MIAGGRVGGGGAQHRGWHCSDVTDLSISSSLREPSCSKRSNPSSKDTGFDPIRGGGGSGGLQQTHT